MQIHLLKLLNRSYVSRNESMCLGTAARRANFSQLLLISECPTSTSPSFCKIPKAQLLLLPASANLWKPNFYFSQLPQNSTTPTSTPEVGFFLTLPVLPPFSLLPAAASSVVSSLSLAFSARGCLMRREVLRWRLGSRSRCRPPPCFLLWAMTASLNSWDLFSHTFPGMWTRPEGLTYSLQSTPSIIVGSSSPSQLKCCASRARWCPQGSRSRRRRCACERRS